MFSGLRFPQGHGPKAQSQWPSGLEIAEAWRSSEPSPWVGSMLADGRVSLPMVVFQPIKWKYVKQKVGKRRERQQTSVTGKTSNP